MSQRNYLKVFNIVENNKPEVDQDGGSREESALQPD